MFYFPSPINILAKLNESLSVICWLILCKCNVWGETLLKWQQTQALGALNQATSFVQTLNSWSHNFLNVRNEEFIWNLLRMSDWMLRLAVVMKRTRQMRIRRWWHRNPSQYWTLLSVVQRSSRWYFVLGTGLLVECFSHTSRDMV